MFAACKPLRLAVMLAAVAAALPLPAQQARQEVRVLQRDPTGRRDSVVVRLMPSSADELLREVLQLRERETKLAGELRALPEEEVVARRRVIEQLQLAVREQFALMSVIEKRCIEERAVPEGFLGINLTSTGERRSDGSVALQGAFVTSVDPGSPAERAGIAQGDRVLSIGGRDFQDDLPSMSDLLTVGRRIAVRTERDGRQRETTITVARRPESFGQSCGRFERALQPLRMAGPGRIVMEYRLPRRRPIGDSALAASLPRPGTAPSDEIRVFVFAPSAGGMRSTGFYAGAELRPLDDEWRQALGLKSGVTGVIVSEVAPGSPSALSGLRKGDVITAVGKSPATSPEVAVRLLSLVGGDEATLTVTRGKDRRTVTLRTAPR